LERIAGKIAVQIVRYLNQRQEESIDKERSKQTSAELQRRDNKETKKLIAKYEEKKEKQSEIENYQAPNMEAKIKMIEGQFPNYQRYLDAQARGVDNFKDLCLIEQFNAPDLETAKKKFLINKYNAPDYETALKIRASDPEYVKIKERQEEKEKFDKMKEFEIYPKPDFRDNPLYILVMSTVILISSDVMITFLGPFIFGFALNSNLPYVPGFTGLMILILSIFLLVIAVTGYIRFVGLLFGRSYIGESSILQVNENGIITRHIKTRKIINEINWNNIVKIDVENWNKKNQNKPSKIIFKWVKSFASGILEIKADYFEHYFTRSQLYNKLKQIKEKSSKRNS
jgi:hypothetical protein